MKEVDDVIDDVKRSITEQFFGKYFAGKYGEELISAKNS